MKKLENEVREEALSVAGFAVGSTILLISFLFKAWPVMIALWAVLRWPELLVPLWPAATLGVSPALGVLLLVPQILRCMPRTAPPHELTAEVWLRRRLQALGRDKLEIFVVPLEHEPAETYDRPGRQLGLSESARTERDDTAYLRAARALGRALFLVKRPGLAWMGAMTRRAKLAFNFGACLLVAAAVTGAHQIVSVAAALCGCAALAQVVALRFELPTALLGAEQLRAVEHIPASGATPEISSASAARVVPLIHLWLMQQGTTALAYLATALLASPVIETLPPIPLPVSSGVPLAGGLALLAKLAAVMCLLGPMLPLLWTRRVGLFLLINLARLAAAISAIVLVALLAAHPIAAAHLCAFALAAAPLWHMFSRPLAIVIWWTVAVILFSISRLAMLVGLPPLSAAPPAALDESAKPAARPPRPRQLPVRPAEDRFYLAAQLALRVPLAWLTLQLL